MEQHETQYRGYNIKAKHRGQDWFLSVTPSRPDLPLLRRYSFRAKVISAEDAPQPLNELPTYLPKAEVESAAAASLTLVGRLRAQYGQGRRAQAWWKPSFLLCRSHKKPRFQI